MALAPGTLLGPYKVSTQLGAGGMSEVYKGVDTRLDRTVAVEVLASHVANDPDLPQRFEREAKTLAALSHPHTLPHPRRGQRRRYALPGDGVPGGQALAYCLESGALQLDRAQSTAIEIADALDKVHRAGIIHRDLKPGNVMLTKSMRSFRGARPGRRLSAA